jgi:predicted signal transduction protein with EAL and GGDEF domain
VMMTNFGCTELQGFYFSKALAADQMTRLLSTFEPKRIAQGPQSLQIVATHGGAG